MNINNFEYLENFSEYKRIKTRAVEIGNVPLGGDFPIRIQSMTTTNTMDTEATVNQIISLAKAGCDYVRVTAPSIKDAENLKNIKNELKSRGYDIPLIADIHYTPNAAEVAARIVEKIRINPGNYTDKKKFLYKDYSDKEYEEEIEKIREKFVPLINVCKEYGTAIRIGSNHGSLSDRILSRYGDTPEGMVESAMEFVNICRENNFHNIVLSMKSSNTRVMVQAYRLLVARLKSLGEIYPIHLGVTEAGDGIDGRAKSSIGIGTLLSEGIGDTIRVSLTEPPENEIPVAKILVNRLDKFKTIASLPKIKSIPKKPFEYKKRKTFEVAGIGGERNISVIQNFEDDEEITAESIVKLGFSFNENKIVKNANSPDFFASKRKGRKTKLINIEKLEENKGECLNNVPLSHFEKNSDKPVVVTFDIDEMFSDNFNEIANNENVIFLPKIKGENYFLEMRRIFFELDDRKIENPVILHKKYDTDDFEKLTVFASTDFGSVFLEGYGDAIWIESENFPHEKINELSFAILQASRVRISKTEYIACPSCGRTLFDLVEVTNKIREKTSHLVGVKIGIMGCIVNGPGEMADADYGYVGTGPGKITLYKGQKVVKRNIPSEIAVEELINLIKENGDWKEREEG